MFKSMLVIMKRNHVKNSMILIQFIFAFLAIFLLMTESVNMVKALTSDIGYDQRNLLGVQVSKLWGIASEEEFNSNHAKLAQAISEIEALPFIKRAGTTWAYPLAPYSSSSHVFQRGFETKESVEALGLEIIHGRNFTKDDAFATDEVFLINEKAYDYFQKKFGTEIIGSNYFQLEAGSDTATVEGVGRVVGVYREYLLRGRYNTQNEFSSLMINRFANKDYFKKRLSLLSRSQGMIIRTNGSVSTSKATFEVTEVLDQIFTDRSVYVYSIEQLAENASRGPKQKFFTLLFICFILVFVISIGIIAITKENLNKRIREIGVRMALGSTDFQVAATFFGELLTLSFIASLVGSTAVFLLDHFEVLQFSLRWQEFVFTALSLMIISIMSIYIPVRKASKMRPNIALHYE